jgi:YidC/Oxa1 family membrane protein insertase
MSVWTAFVDVLEAAFFVLTQAFGGNLAWAIIAFALGVRLALLPLTYWVARRGQAQQIKLKALRPDLAKLRQRFQRDPHRLMTETSRLYAKHDVALADGRSLLGTLVQLPVVMGMYSALRRVLDSGLSGRFLWIKDISRADLGLALVVAAMTYLVTLLSPQLSTNARWMITVVPMAITLVVLSRMSAGYGLYWGASTIVSGLQAALLRRAMATRVRHAAV